MEGHRPRPGARGRDLADFAVPAQMSQLARGLSRADYMGKLGGYTTDPRFATARRASPRCARAADRWAAVRDDSGRPMATTKEDG